MTRIVTRLAAICALSLASAAAAQPVPTPGPPPNTGTAQDPMNPFSTPSGKEAGHGMADPQDNELLYGGAREQAVDGSAAKARAVAATAAEIIPGSDVSDSRGKPVGKVESVSADGAVVVAAGGKVMVPLGAFGKNKKGLLLSITKSEFDAAVASAVSAQ